MSRTLGTVVAVLLVAALVALILRGSAAATAEEKLAVRRAEYERDRAALASKPNGRPALVEPALPGNAWDDVLRLAERVAKAVPEPEAEETEEVAVARAVALFDEQHDLAASLADVVRRPCSAPRFTDFDGDVDAPPFRTWETYRLAEIAHRVAVSRGSGARAAEALEITSATAAIGSDVQRLGGFGFHLGAAIRIQSAIALRGVMAVAAPTADECRRAVELREAVDAHAVRLSDALHAVDVLDRGWNFGLAKRPAIEGSVEKVWDARRWQWAPAVRAIAALERQDETRGELDEIRARPTSEWMNRTATMLGRPIPDDEALDGRGAAIVLKSELFVQFRASLARTALAIAWHVAETGRAPAGLEALVPRYLPSLTECPLSGQPLRYSASPCRVWSIGRDGKDDGGRAIEDPYGLEGDGDVVWDVRVPR